MKKTYIIPTLQVVKIQPAQLMNNIPTGSAYQSGDEVLSRRGRFSSWEEEEE